LRFKSSQWHQAGRERCVLNSELKQAQRYLTRPFDFLYVTVWDDLGLQSREAAFDSLVACLA